MVEVCETDRSLWTKVGLPYGGIGMTLSLIGYFLYGGVNGFLAVLTIMLVMTIVGLMLGMIPFIGVVVYAFVGYNYLLPYMFDITPIEGMDWLMWLVFILSVLGSLTMTYYATWDVLNKRVF